MSFGFRSLCLARSLLAALLISSTAVSGDEGFRIAHREQVTNFFSDSELSLHLDLEASKPIKGRLQWRLSAKERTLASREVAFAVDPGKVASAQVRCQLPPVKPGVIFPLRLQAALVADLADKPSAQFEETLYLFAPNPFLDRTEWLQKLDLNLFDPEESTARALDALEVPYRRVTNLESLSELTKGVVIVGEGVAWEDYGPLGKVLLDTAMRGASVLCLSPAAAEFSLPLSVDRSAAVSGLSLRRRDVIRELDKRFSLAWEAGRPVETRELAMVVDGEKLLARAGEPGQGWPWLQISYAPGAGKFTWCGFGLIRSWDKSPTARYLLERILQTYSPEAIKSESSAIIPLN